MTPAPTLQPGDRVRIGTLCRDSVHPAFFRGLAGVMEEELLSPVQHAYVVTFDVPLQVGGFTFDSGFFAAAELDPLDDDEVTL